MTDYSQLSDFEINGYIEAETCGFSSFEFVDGKGVIRGSGEGSPGFIETVPLDYCSNPADAWPIIKQAEISILKDNGLHLWSAASSAYWADGSEWQISGEVMDENPLRAAMIVYLMLKESESS